MVARADTSFISLVIFKCKKRTFKNGVQYDGHVFRTFMGIESSGKIDEDALCYFKRFNIAAV